MITYSQLIEAVSKWLGTDDISKGDYTKTLRTKFQNQLNKIHKAPELTKDERGALAHYSGSMHGQINDKFRNPKNTENDMKDEDHESYVNDIDSAMNKHTTKHDLHVWRGIKYKEDVKGFKANPGDIIHDKGYVSTSINPAVARHFTRDHTDVFHIKVPKGSKVIHPLIHGIGSASEQEVILPHHSKFRYDSSTRHTLPADTQGNTGYTVHHLTHIPGEE